MTGADIAAEIAAALREAGAEVGDGAPLIATLTKTPRPENPGDPDPGPPVGYAVAVMVSDYDLQHVDGTQIQAHDRQVLMEAAEVAPLPGDKLTVNGTAYNVIRAMPLEPGGVALMYEVQCRKQ
ncbi:hypothetical protein LCM17_18640 [Cereibacter sphaeroides]|nr:hypothetical protein [Cereibacter sphaeroides]